jgi:MoxR-like ATPase
MHAPPDPVRQTAASSRFIAFFRELEGVFVEREDILRQIALALLAREHVLLTGPPGTAKSLIASSVFSRLIDESTGKPSLYARQFTESTVQTDLIGPINFKTLTETGRTEHFTDEGMLGAVHAFLDEVFDGRDMLLRSALNVLHEREIKQGTRITKGRFECAFMASNRYLAEVLESSRETLLAFVDRIAFTGFVPRSFADPQNLRAVLKGQVAGVGPSPLEAPLSIQDIDALQAVVENVFVSEEICDGLAAFLDLFDSELNAAVRADSTFLPTRYLSTRTAVRSGRILRAICVYDKLWNRPSRPLEVLPEDLAGLRFHLLLSGPSPEAITKLLERESDPRERRQLGILRTEREIFERCLAKLPPIRVVPRVAPPAKTPEQSGGAAPSPGSPDATGRAGTEGPQPTQIQKQKPLRSKVEEDAIAAFASGEASRIASAVRALVPASQGAGPEAENAAALVKEGVTALHAQAMRAGLASSGEERVMIAEAASELGVLATTVEQATPLSRSLGRWLRGRALVLIGEVCGSSLATSIPALDEATSGSPTLPSPMDQAAARIEKLEALSLIRKRLIAEGVDARELETADLAWARGIDRAEDEIALLCDAAVHEVAHRRLSDIKGQEIGQALEKLAPEFERIEALEKRMSALSPRRSALCQRALGPRVGLLVAAAFARMNARERTSLSGEVEATLGVLRRAGLARVITPRAWVTWTAEALLRAEAEAPNAREDGDGEDLSYEGYRKLRGAAPRVLNAFVLAEVALRVAPEVALSSSGSDETSGVVPATLIAPSSPEARAAGGVPALAALLAELPEDARSGIVKLDFERIERALGLLERWWDDLDAAGERPAPSEERSREEGASDEQILRRIVRSRFFSVLMDEAALVRFLLEVRLLAELFPDHAARAEVVRERLQDLGERARRRLIELFRRRGDAAWASLVHAPVQAAQDLRSPSGGKPPDRSPGRAP